MKCDKIVRIGEHKIGPGHSPFFIAELGICHEGSVDIALELAKAAIDAGANMIKTESFMRRKMVFDNSAETTYSIKGKKITVPLAEHMDKYELTPEEHERILLYCKDLGVPFMSTVHCFEAADLMAELGASAIKIASPDIVHYPLLRYVAQKKLPVFLDTGAALQYEIELAVRTLRKEGLEDIIVNHNPSGHPALPENHDLNIIPRLKKILDIPIGLSDHSDAYEMLFIAVALGANSIEKPISIDNSIEGPERNYSISIPDLPGVLKRVHGVYLALGRSERISLSQAEEKYRYNNRMVCIAAQDLYPGDEVNFENVIFGRPRKGIGVEHWDLIAGRKLRNSKKKNEFLGWEDIG